VTNSSFQFAIMMLDFLKTPLLLL